MDPKKSYRNWLPLPQLPTSSPAPQQTEDYISAGASASPISLTTDPSHDFDYENDFDGGDVVASVVPEAENIPLAVIQRRDAERQKNLSSDFDYENDYDSGEVVTSVLFGTGQVSSAVKQRRDIENQNDLFSDFDYENYYDGGDVVTSELSGTEKLPSAGKQRRDVDKDNDLSSDFDYENDYDDGSAVTSMLSETENVPSVVKQRREKEKRKAAGPSDKFPLSPKQGSYTDDIQRGIIKESCGIKTNRTTGIYMYAGTPASPHFNQTNSPGNPDDENDYDDGGIVTSMLSGTEQDPSGVKQRRNKEKQRDPKSTKGKGCGGRLSIVILYFLVIICLVMWSALFSLFLVKFSALSEELKALNLNHSELLVTVKKDLDYIHATQEIIERTVSNNISELQDIAASICVRVDISSSQSCPHRWKFHGKNCYFFSTEKKNWTNALWYCIQHKSFLVSIWSDTEQGFLKNSINNTGTYWLGMTDMERSGHWKWKEGDLFVTTAFWNPWALSKNSNQDCGIMHPNGTWGPAMCSLPYQWICKKKVIC